MAVHASHWRYIVAHVLERRVRHAIASQNDMAISRNRCLARVCVCRYSGILFAFASLESFLSPAPTRSLFGMITVPTRLYPWALLIVLQLLPNISLLGHLSGLIVGMLCVPARQPVRWEEERAPRRVPRRRRPNGRRGEQRRMAARVGGEAAFQGGDQPCHEFEGVERRAKG